MTIQFKQLGDTCSPNYSTAEVEFFKTYRGHKVYKEVGSFWHYVQVNGEWNYFASWQEAYSFIRQIIY